MGGDENKALIVVEKLNAVTLFKKDGGMEVVLDEIKKKVDEFKPDVSTLAGRKDIASLAYKVARSKTLIDDLGKGQVADMKRDIREKDGVRKQARDFLDNLKTEARAPLTQWEKDDEARRVEEERIKQERIDGIQAKIGGFHSQVESARGKSSKEIEQVRDMLIAIDIKEEEFQEFLEDAKDAQSVAHEKLVLMAYEKAAEEAADEARRVEDERLKKVRKEQEAKEALLEEERLKQAAKKAADEKILQDTADKIEKERLALQAEKDAIEATKKAEQERKEREAFEAQAKEAARVKAEEDAKAAAVKAEADRVANEKAEADEKARQESLRPDKEKMEAWLKLFNNDNLPKPTLASKEARAMLKSSMLGLGAWLVGARDKVDKL